MQTPFLHVRIPACHLHPDFAYTPRTSASLRKLSLVMKSLAAKYKYFLGKQKKRRCTYKIISIFIIREQTEQLQLKKYMYHLKNVLDSKKDPQ